MLAIRTSSSCVRVPHGAYINTKVVLFEYRFIEKVVFFIGGTASQIRELTLDSSSCQSVSLISCQSYRGAHRGKDNQKCNTLASVGCLSFVRLDVLIMPTSCTSIAPNNYLCLRMLFLAVARRRKRLCSEPFDFVWSLTGIYKSYHCRLRKFLSAARITLNYRSCLPLLK